MMFAQSVVTGVGVVTTLPLLLLGYLLTRGGGEGAAARARLVQSRWRFAALLLLVVAVVTFVVSFQPTVCVIDASHGAEEYHRFKLVGSTTVQGQSGPLAVTLPPNARFAIANDTTTKFALRRVFYSAGSSGAKPPYVFKIVEPATVVYVNDELVELGGAPSSIQSSVRSESRLELVPATTEDLKK